MASQVDLGSFLISLEQQGLKIIRKGLPTEQVAAPLLTFRMTEAERPPAIFTIQRINANGHGRASFHGSVTQRIALDGEIVYRRDLDGLEVNFRVENASDDMQVRFSVHLDATGEADPRWLIPGFMYNKNRPENVEGIFPGFSEFGKDIRQLVSNEWAVRSDRTALPVVCCWTHNLFSYIYSPPSFGESEETPDGIGMSGLYFSTDTGHPVSGVEFPYREYPAKFSFCHDDDTDPEETFIYLPSKTPIRASVVFGAGAPDLNAYRRVVRSLYNQLKEKYMISPRLTAPEELEGIAFDGLLKYHYDHRQSAVYETACFDRHFAGDSSYVERPHMHAGWLSGGLPAYTMLWAGREGNNGEAIHAGASVFDKFSSELSPCGTIFPVWTEEYGWSCSFGPEEGTGHSRTIAEAIYFMLKATGLELKHNQVHLSWAEAILSSLNYAMGAQRDDGCFPVYFDLTTGRPTDFSGSGGMAWIAALALGASVLQREHFKEVACRAGEYYSSMLHQWELNGSLEDQYCVPSADDYRWALISYMALYEIDRDTKWLRLARKAADLCMTWRFAYNVDFPYQTMAGAYRVETRGGDISSVASPTTGPSGLLIYGDLVKLASYLGDDYYFDRAEDSRFFSMQLVAEVDGQFNAREGMVGGQIFHTDWWQPKGIVLSVSDVMASALIKYAALQMRSLEINRDTVLASKELEEPIADDGVLYRNAVQPKNVTRESKIRGPEGVVGADAPGVQEKPKDNFVPRGPAPKDGSLTGNMMHLLGIKERAPSSRDSQVSDIFVPPRFELDADQRRQQEQSQAQPPQPNLPPIEPEEPKGSMLPKKVELPDDEEVAPPAPPQAAARNGGKPSPFTNFSVSKDEEPAEEKPADSSRDSEDEVEIKYKIF